MPGSITLLWLLDEPDHRAVRDERFRHAYGNPDRPAAAITSLLAQGAVLAVVRSEDEGQRALAHGADEVAIHAEMSGDAFEKIVGRTVARARARFHRDLFLASAFRKDDASAHSLLATALGQHGLERSARRNELLSPPSSRSPAIAEMVAEVAGVVEKLRAPAAVDSGDQVVDIAQIARDVLQSLAPRIMAELEVRIVDRICPVRMPRWQATIMVATLIASAVDAADESGCVAVDVFVQDGAVVLQVADPAVGEPDADPAISLLSARVRRAGGELMIEADPGIGRLFRMFLPLVGGPPTRGEVD
jgi:signal transduction histidine kinase